MPRSRRPGRPSMGGRGTAPKGRSRIRFRGRGESSGFSGRWQNSLPSKDRILARELAARRGHRRQQSGLFPDLHGQPPRTPCQPTCPFRSRQPSWSAFSAPVHVYPPTPPPRPPRPDTRPRPARPMSAKSGRPSRQGRCGDRRDCAPVSGCDGGSRRHGRRGPRRPGALRLGIRPARCAQRRAERVDADTVFQLASVSKPLGATVVACAVHAGTVAWDAPVVNYLPGFALLDPYVTRHVTLEALYAHRSGLPDHVGDKLEDLGNPGDVVRRRFRFHSFGQYESSVGQVIRQVRLTKDRTRSLDVVNEVDARNRNRRHHAHGRYFPL